MLGCATCSRPPTSLGCPALYPRGKPCWLAASWLPAGFSLWEALLVGDWREGVERKPGHSLPLPPCFQAVSLAERLPSRAMRSSCHSSSSLRATPSLLHALFAALGLPCPRLSKSFLDSVFIWNCCEQFPTRTLIHAQPLKYTHFTLDKNLEIWTYVSQVTSCKICHVNYILGNLWSRIMTPSLMGFW